MNHKMTTTTPFILLGLDADSFHNDKLMKMFRERGYNILYNTDESHFSSAWYVFGRNKRPTIVVNCFTDEVRDYDIDLGSFVTVYELDEAMFNYGKETAQEAPEQDEQDEDDDDYAPICFSSHGGFYGYDEGLDML
ncbi:hypothetical protein [Escherichia coli]|uniref:Uncharacterized protein n=1 Tax=Escherichia coli TaxID=562 RepID=A0A8T5YHY5_ECOLX|nr:hypothetical protein [Escherichia coli]EHZ8542247.1 hypothetical protein [Escherichia coli]MVW15110.1 hypothetical protein [Escherichia coli]MWK98827.1 hypothetical protein [Escherichia coli]